MSVYKDGSQWRYRRLVTLPNGSTERISGTPAINTKIEAEKAERAHIERTLDPSKAAPKVEPKRAPGFSQFASEWLAVYPASAGNKPSMIESRSYHIRFHLVPYFGSRPLDEIDTFAVAEFIAHLKEQKTRRNVTRRKAAPEKDPKPIAVQTVKNVVATLRKILKSAHEWNKIADLPKIPKIKVPEAPWDFLTQEEAARLLHVMRTFNAPAEDFAKVITSLKTGIREGELLALTWDDVDFRAMTLRVERGIHRRIVGPPKNGKPRTIDLSPSVAEALKAIRHLRGSLVFCDPDGRYLTPSHLTWIAEKWLKRAGLRRMSWHDFRHTFASHLTMAGINLKQVQTWMGHSTINVTMRYAHLAPSEGKRAIAVLDAPTAA